MVQPDGGEQWIKGNKYRISWTDNLKEKVKIEVTGDANAGSPTWYELTPSGGVGGSLWTWNTNTNWPGGLPTTGTHFKIRISSTNSNSTTPPAVSAGEFSFVLTLGGTATMQQPVGGETWYVGTKYLISWVDDIAENVVVKLFTKSGGAWDAGTIISPNGTSGVKGSTIYWKPTAAGTYKIRVESIYDSQYGGEGGEFTVVQPLKVELYPNPSTTQVTIKFSEEDNTNYTLTLYNRYNMRVITKPVNTTYMKQVRINTFNLPNGVYFLRLVSPKGVISRKVIVQH